MDLTVDLKAFAYSPRDSKQERAFARQMRQVPENQRFVAIQELMEYNSGHGLRLATATLQRPHYFQTILEQGLKCADAHSMQNWLECVVPKLGFRRVAATLMRWLDIDPVAVLKALYWLPSLLPENDNGAWTAWQELKSAVAPYEHAYEQERLKQFAGDKPRLIGV